MKVSEVEIGRTYRLVMRFDLDYATPGYARVIDGPLPMEKRGRFGFLVKHLSGKHLDEESLIPATSLNALVDDEWNEKRVRNARRLSKQRLHGTPRQRHLAALAEAQDLHGLVHLSAAKNGTATLTFTEESEHLLPEILALISIQGDPASAKTSS